MGKSSLFLAQVLSVNIWSGYWKEGEEILKDNEYFLKEYIQFKVVEIYKM